MKIYFVEEKPTKEKNTNKEKMIQRKSCDAPL